MSETPTHAWYNPLGWNNKTLKKGALALALLTAGGVTNTALAQSAPPAPSSRAVPTTVLPRRNPQPAPPGRTMLGTAGTVVVDDAEAGIRKVGRGLETIVSDTYNGTAAVGGEISRLGHVHGPVVMEKANAAGRTLLETGTDLAADAAHLTVRTGKAAGNIAIDGAKTLGTAAEVAGKGLYRGAKQHGPGIYSGVKAVGNGVINVGAGMYSIAKTFVTELWSAYKGVPSTHSRINQYQSVPLHAGRISQSNNAQNPSANTPVINTTARVQPAKRIQKTQPAKKSAEPSKGVFERLGNWFTSLQTSNTIDFNVDPHTGPRTTKPLDYQKPVVRQVYNTSLSMSHTETILDAIENRDYIRSVLEFNAALPGWNNIEAKFKAGNATLEDLAALPTTPLPENFKPAETIRREAATHFSGFVNSLAYVKGARTGLQTEREREEAKAEFTRLSLIATEYAVLVNRISRTDFNSATLQNATDNLRKERDNYFREAKQHYMLSVLAHQDTTVAIRSIAKSSNNARQFLNSNSTVATLYQANLRNATEEATKAAIRMAQAAYLGIEVENIGVITNKYVDHVEALEKLRNVKPGDYFYIEQSVEHITRRLHMLEAVARQADNRMFNIYGMEFGRENIIGFNVFQKKVKEIQEQKKTLDAFIQANYGDMSWPSFSLDMIDNTINSYLKGNQPEIEPGYPGPKQEDFEELVKQLYRSHRRLGGSYDSRVKRDKNLKTKHNPKGRVTLNKDGVGLGMGVMRNAFGTFPTVRPYDPLTGEQKLGFVEIHSDEYFDSMVDSIDADGNFKPTIAASELTGTIAQVEDKYFSVHRALAADKGARAWIKSQEAIYRKAKEAKGDKAERAYVQLLEKDTHRESVMSHFDFPGTYRILSDPDVINYMIQKNVMPGLVELIDKGQDVDQWYISKKDLAKYLNVAQEDMDSSYDMDDANSEFESLLREVVGNAALTHMMRMPHMAKQYGDLRRVRADGRPELNATQSHLLGLGHKAEDLKRALGDGKYLQQEDPAIFGSNGYVDTRAEWSAAIKAIKGELDDIADYNKNPFAQIRKLAFSPMVTFTIGSGWTGLWKAFGWYDVASKVIETGNPLKTVRHFALDIPARRIENLVNMPKNIAQLSKYKGAWKVIPMQLWGAVGNYRSIDNHLTRIRTGTVGYTHPSGARIKTKNAAHTIKSIVNPWAHVDYKVEYPTARTGTRATGYSAQP